MPVFRLTPDEIISLSSTTFIRKGLKERSDLQRLLRANVQIIDPDIMVISEEFCEWEESKRRIDLLAIDREANLVVIELKRDNEGGHMELQAIRYAAMVSRMTFERAIRTFEKHLKATRHQGDARQIIDQFLQGEKPNDEEILEVRIVLVAADFAKELTTAVLWLNEWELDIRCVKIKPYDDAGSTILEVQQVVPLPEASEYQVSIRQETISRREQHREGGESTGYWFMNTGQGSNNSRSWEDSRKYGFMLAGGGPKWINDVRKLRVGDKLFAYLSGSGYVGLGIVTAEAVPMKDFIPSGSSIPLMKLPLSANVDVQRINNPPQTDWCASVRWIKALPSEQGFMKNAARRSTLEKIKKPELVSDLLKHFGISPESVR